MYKNNKLLRSWLSSALGNKLTCVFALIYIYDGEENLDSPQKIDLRFESDIPSVLSCSSDGSSIRFSHNAMIEADLGNYGKQVFKDMSTQSTWQKYINKTVRKLELIYSQREMNLMGLRFEFEGKLSLTIVNLGDEFRIFGKLPENIVKEEEVKYYVLDKGEKSARNQ